MGLKRLLIWKTIVFNAGVTRISGELALFGEILAVLSLITVLIVSFFSLRNMNRYNSTFDSLKNLVGRDEEGHIVMDERIVAVIDAVASRLFQAGKMSMLQGLSVDSKKLKGIKAAMAQDVVEEKMPLLQIAGDFMGVNTKEYIKKYPDAIFQLVQIPAVQKFLLKMSGGNSPGLNPGNRGRM